MDGIGCIIYFIPLKICIVLTVQHSFHEQIMKYTRDGHYQIACKYYFDATHSGVEEPDVNINHPNQYFDESQHFYSGKKEGIVCTHVVNLKRVGCGVCMQ